MIMNRIYYLLLISLSLGACATVRSVQTDQAQLTQYEFADIDSLQALKPRPVAVFLHAPWCKFCQNMKQTTFVDREVIQLLNEEFYFISFDGEQEENVLFRGHTFRFERTGRTSGIHQLAKAVGTIDKKVVYPTLALLDSNLEIVFQHQGYLNSHELTSVLMNGFK